MNVNLFQIKKLSRQRGNYVAHESKPIGSAIKFKRTAMKMTLEEGSEGICSVSYLSKLENNLIDPSDQFIDSLIERFGLEDFYEESEDTYEDDLEQIGNHFITSTIPDESFVVTYLERKDYQAQLIQMGYYSLLEDDEQAMKSYHDLKTYIPHLNDEEFSLFMIFINMQLFKENRHNEAFELLLLAPSFENLSENSVLLLLKWRLLNAFRMHKISEVLNHYPIYVNKVLDVELYQLLKEIRNAYVQFEAYFQHPNDMKKTLSKMYSLSQGDRDYALAKSMFHHQHYDKVIDLAKPYYRNKSQWLILYLMSLDYEKKHQEIINILSNSDQLKGLCKTSKLIISHMKYKYNSDKMQLLNYLRREILGIRHLTDEYHVLDYLMVDAQKLFSKHQHYKEAVQVTTHYLPKLKTLKRFDI
ncbi:MAG: helix-turn-helix transcriptional regulator [Acholeplasmataceae bacterium]|nr:helix-turn-helix transcriptional regulator [Acholeplasmataceae bacterium]